VWAFLGFSITKQERMRRFHLKNKPFWVAILLIIIISVAAYKQWRKRSNESFTNIYAVVGIVFQITTPTTFVNFVKTQIAFRDVEFLNVKDGTTLWKKGDPIENIKVNSGDYIILKIGPTIPATDDILKTMRTSQQLAFRSARGGIFIEHVVLGIDGKTYVTPNGTPIVGSYIVGGFIFNTMTMVGIAVGSVLFIIFAIWWNRASSETSAETLNTLQRIKKPTNNINGSVTKSNGNGNQNPTSV